MDVSNVRHFGWERAKRSVQSSGEALVEFAYALDQGKRQIEYLEEMARYEPEAVHLLGMARANHKEGARKLEEGIRDWDAMVDTLCDAVS